MNQNLKKNKMNLQVEMSNDQKHLLLNFAKWCIKWRVSLGENSLYTYGGGVLSKTYTIEELFDIYSNQAE